MKRRFVIADHHFDHANILNFKRQDGTPVRTFGSAAEMDEYMIEMHNSVVKEHDVVYFLGDVSMTEKGLENLKKMNGSKRLIAGNHDIFRTKKYLEHFKEVRAHKVIVDKCIMSHIPLHPDSVTHRFKVNVHGHLHANEVKKEFTFIDRLLDPDDSGGGAMINMKRQEILPDPRFLCVSVEQPWINYKPLDLDKLEDITRERFKAVGWDYPERKAKEYEEAIS